MFATMPFIPSFIDARSWVVMFTASCRCEMSDWMPIMPISLFLLSPSWKVFWLSIFASQASPPAPLKTGFFSYG